MTAKTALTGEMIPGQSGFPLVGVTGFEPATLRSRTVRATKLRHTPIGPSGPLMSITHAQGLYLLGPRYEPQQAHFGTAGEPERGIRAHAQTGRHMDDRRVLLAAMPVDAPRMLRR